MKWPAFERLSRFRKISFNWFHRPTVRATDFWRAAVASGMRETVCPACGCLLLTRGTSNYCPPHRGFS
jgi:hypothetical protein